MAVKPMNLISETMKNPIQNQKGIALIATLMLLVLGFARCGDPVSALHPGNETGPA